MRPGTEERLPFDQYLEQLLASKQSTHRWLGWLAIATIILTLGVFLYAIYTSIIWKSAGGENVIRGWMYFFLAGGLAAFLMGLETVIQGATLPLPFMGSKYDFKAGEAAVRQGRLLIGYGVVISALVILGVTAVIVS